MAELLSQRCRLEARSEALPGLPLPPERPQRLRLSTHRGSTEGSFTPLPPRAHNNGAVCLHLRHGHQRGHCGPASRLAAARAGSAPARPGAATRHPRLSGAGGLWGSLGCWRSGNSLPRKCQGEVERSQGVPVVLAQLFYGPQDARMVAIPSQGCPLPAVALWDELFPTGSSFRLFSFLSQKKREKKPQAPSSPSPAALCILTAFMAIQQQCLCSPPFSTSLLLLSHKKEEVGTQGTPKGTRVSLTRWDTRVLFGGSQLCFATSTRGTVCPMAPLFHGSGSRAVRKPVSAVSFPHHPTAGHRRGHCVSVQPWLLPTTLAAALL